LTANDFSQLRALMEVQGNLPLGGTNSLPQKTSHPKKHKTKKQTSQQVPMNASNSLKVPKMKSVTNSEKAELFVLRRNIKIQRWNVKATIAKSKKRDDLLPVLMRAKERDGTYAKDIAEHLLGEAVGREVVGIRLLTMCESLMLLENKGEKNRPRYYLTEEGEKALESGNIMVPEEGTWTIWASDDPLLDYPILRVEPFVESLAFDEVYGDKKKDTRSRNDNFEDLPRWFSAVKGIAAMPGAIGNERIRLDSIDKRVEPVSYGASLTIEWNPESHSLKLKGSIDEQSVSSTPKAPDVLFGGVWQELMENEYLWRQWDEENQRLLVDFDSTTKRERSSLLRRLEFKHPGLRKYGAFEYTSRTIEIFPKSFPDAKDWSEWRLTSLISTFATQAEFAQWQQQARELFPEYSRDIELPERSDLAQVVWGDRDEQENCAIKWHLMAVEDWGI
jgi:hypothetical protein